MRENPSKQAPVVVSPEAVSALLEASAAMNSTLEFQSVLQSIAQLSAQVLQAEAASVLILDAARGKLVFRAAVGIQSDALLGQEFDARLGIAGRVASTGRPILVPDVRTDPNFFAGFDEKSSFVTRGMVAAPLRTRGRVLGVVEVINRVGGGGFTEADIDLLQVFANLAATAASNAQSHETLQKENLGLREGATSRDVIVGGSPALRAALALCDRVAASNATVLLLGETGTGKELAARRVHALGPRRDKPFIAIHCAALPETLLESELFGHEAGAFTGATARKLGRFELADGGTLLLDEIGDLSPATQTKLLRVLQEREFVRVGGTRTIACDVRIIAATNRDLKTAVQRGEFREDLYYRLNVFPIVLPPLRDRQDDIPVLAAHYVERSARELGWPPPKITDEAMARLLDYGWPGNIRELRNVVERAVLLCESGRITGASLPREIGEAAGGAAADAESPGGSALEGYERAMIVKTLSEQDWNQTRAAAALGISRDNLRYRLRKYKIRRPGGSGSF